MIEYFIIMQDETCPVQTVKKYRKSLFTEMNRTVDNFPPTEDVLLQQVCRAMLQSVIWSRSTALEEPTIDLQNWGWLADDNGELCPI